MCVYLRGLSYLSIVSPVTEPGDISDERLRLLAGGGRRAQPLQRLVLQVLPSIKGGSIRGFTNLRHLSLMYMAGLSADVLAFPPQLETLIMDLSIVDNNLNWACLQGLTKLKELTWTEGRALPYDHASTPLGSVTPNLQRAVLTLSDDGSVLLGQLKHLEHLTLEFVDDNEEEAAAVQYNGASILQGVGMGLTSLSLSGRISLDSTALHFPRLFTLRLDKAWPTSPAAVSITTGIQQLLVTDKPCQWLTDDMLEALPALNAIFGDVCANTTDAGLRHLQQLKKLSLGPQTQYTAAGLAHITTLEHLTIRLAEGGPKRFHPMDLAGPAFRNPHLAVLELSRCNTPGVSSKLIQLGAVAVTMGFHVMEEHDNGNIVVMRRAAAWSPAVVPLPQAQAQAQAQAPLGGQSQAPA